MKLHIYRGLDRKTYPPDLDVTHVIVHESVTAIKKGAFVECRHLVSVIMGDSVKRIEGAAFGFCTALKFIRLSKTLEYIGLRAFYGCESLEALFLPSTVKTIVHSAFRGCPSLRLAILPNCIDLQNIGLVFIHTDLLQLAISAGVIEGYISSDANEQQHVHNWLIHHMDAVPFHKVCYDSSVDTQKISDYLKANGNNSALQTDPFRGMTPLHMLSMNPNAPADAIAALLNSNMEAVFHIDNQQKTALEYAREYNVGGLVAMIARLCNHRNS